MSMNSSKLAAPSPFTSMETILYPGDPSRSTNLPYSYKLIQPLSCQVQILETVEGKWPSSRASYPVCSSPRTTLHSPTLPRQSSPAALHLHVFFICAMTK
ncbi:hypothetical protein NE237_016732 [Protea cynaroides]|uniref:Uncharacterized protein n=1 Tax=Protea cynaroides TaxID=273540 RepID=A0A9Q0HHG5_9MAGN|nr:hypothetical protein NE237_016732 [Protea cynaroides]